MTRVGLITVTYNSDRFLEKFVESLNQTQSKYEFVVIVIDNASEVNPTGAFRSCNLQTKLVRNDVNVGVAQANNQGAKIALESGCNVLIFLNNDIEFGESVLQKLVAKTVQGSAIVSPRILRDDAEKTVWFENGKFNPIKGWTGQHCNASTEGTVQQVSYMPTCFSCMSAELFHKIGDFDSKYFVYFDDTDFMYRAFKLGINMVVLMNVEIIHRVGGTTGGLQSSFTAYQTSKNRLIFIKKHKGVMLAAAFTAVFVFYYIVMTITGKRNKIWLKNALKGTSDAWLA